jgi:hypothetical protein
VDISKLKEKIDIYIKECGYTWDFAAILNEYNNYRQRVYVSFTANDVISQFEKELKEIKYEKIESFEGFEKLKNDDFILVKWDKYFIKHTKNSREYMFYKIYEHKERQQEIICKMPQNHFFNYHCILIEKSSSAKEVYLISSEDTMSSN